MNTGSLTPKPTSLTTTVNTALYYVPGTHDWSGDPLYSAVNTTRDTMKEKRGWGWGSREGQN